MCKELLVQSEDLDGYNVMQQIVMLCSELAFKRTDGLLRKVTPRLLLSSGVYKNDQVNQLYF